MARSLSCASISLSRKSPFVLRTVSWVPEIGQRTHCRIINPQYAVHPFRYFRFEDLVALLANNEVIDGVNQVPLEHREIRADPDSDYRQQANRNSLTPGGRVVGIWPYRNVFIHIRTPAFAKRGHSAS